MLELLSDKLITQITGYLLPRDVMNLSMSSRGLYDICNSNDVWKVMFERFLAIHCENKVPFYTDDWKFLCYQIYVFKHDDEELHRLFCIGSDINKSLTDRKARLDVLSTLVENFEDGSSIDSSEDLVNIQEIQRSVSMPSLRLASRNSSTTNLMVVPSTSVCSILETFEETTPEKFLFSAQVMTEMGISKSKLTFNRYELKKRLQNLVNISFKNSTNDVELSLPGNMTTKFALRYREA